MLRDYCFRTINSVSTLLAAPASPFLNNRTTGTAMVVYQPLTITPGAQRNFWGKSAGVNRNVLFNNSTGYSFLYGSGTGGAPLDHTCAVAGTALPILADRPCVLAITWSFGSPASMYGGILGGPPLREASAYVARQVGTMGSTPHDDSASSLALCAAVGGANVMDALYWSIQWWDEVLSLEVLQQRARDYNPVGTLGSWRFGAAGSALVIDDSGHGHHAPVTSTSSPVLTTDLKLVHRRGLRLPSVLEVPAPAVVPPTGGETVSLFVSTPA